MHTLLDLRGGIPAFTWVTEAADVRILDELVSEPGSIYVFVRAFVDFARLHRLHEARVGFLTRAKKGLRRRRTR